MIRELAQHWCRQSRDLAPKGEVEMEGDVAYHTNPDNPTPFTLELYLHVAYDWRENLKIRALLEAIEDIQKGAETIPHKICEMVNGRCKYCGSEE